MECGENRLQGHRSRWVNPLLNLGFEGLDFFRQSASEKEINKPLLVFLFSSDLG